jgi:hypothetical protein
VSDGLLPEDLKMRELEAGIAALMDEVAGLEAELEAEKAALERFRMLYFERVGCLILFLDVLDAALADAAARRDPADAGLKRAAAEARARLEEAREQAEAAEASPPAEITPELRARYREAIRRMHPDLARDEADRAYRTEVTQRLNEAYRQGDAAAVNAILRDFQLAEMPDNAGKRLILLIRQEYALRQRIEAIRAELAELADGDLAQMRATCEADGEEGITELREQLLAQIAAKSRQVAEIGLVPTGFEAAKGVHRERAEG